jgi:hypothetical protein
MTVNIFAPDTIKIVSKSKNLRGLVDYARRFPPVAYRFEVNRCPDTGAPYFLRVEFSNGAVCFSHWQDWRVCAWWINARRSWPKGLPLITYNGDFAAILAKGGAAFVESPPL